MGDAPVTLVLLILNGVVSGYTLLIDPSLIDRLSLRPRRMLRKGEYGRLFTAGFVHVGLAHLAFNMITLFFFGPALERLLGPGGFLLLYVGSELAAHGLSVALHHDNPHYAAVGASGAVSGVVFGFCLFYPLAEIYLFLIPIGIPAILFAFLYVGFSIYAMQGGREQGMTGGIAHEAHLGGAIAGLVLTLLLEPAVLGDLLGRLGL